MSKRRQGNVLGQLPTLCPGSIFLANKKSLREGRRDGIGRQVLRTVFLQHPVHVQISRAKPVKRNCNSMHATLIVHIIDGSASEPYARACYVVNYLLECRTTLNGACIKERKRLLINCHCTIVSGGRQSQRGAFSLDAFALTTDRKRADESLIYRSLMKTSAYFTLESIFSAHRFVFKGELGGRKTNGWSVRKKMRQ